MAVGLSHWRRTLSDRDEQGDTPAYKGDAHHAADPVACRDGFFQHDKHRNPGDPIEVHDATEKQQAHQEPTATNAKRTMLDPHTERATKSVSPMGKNELQGRSAMTETGLFKWG